MEHTPGPWKVNEDEFLVYVEGEEEDYCICDVQAIRTNVIRLPKVALANARLIAAAPDLLEALINLVNIVNELDFTGYDTKGEDPSDWTKQACAAIAKAGGKS